MTCKVRAAVASFAIGLLGIAWLRLQTGSGGLAGSLTGHATLIYIGVTISAAIVFIRIGIPVRDLGFEPKFHLLSHIPLALAGVALLQLNGVVIEPVWEEFFGVQRNLQRFSEIHGSLPTLLSMLAFSWLTAAFGEEIAFRVLLLRGIACALGHTRGAFVIALVLQAAVFGLVHAYQGPVGVAGTVTSGLVYGSLALIARGSIWPPALAHGMNNTIGLIAIYMGY
ncbi:MAG: CPBP family intramembrane metalloprotease [Gammaproteobacteria bacterium]|jgi:membrane protease YdiL (CAAX protease family)